MTSGELLVIFRQKRKRAGEPRMINLSSFIAFHARRMPARCALKYRGEDISYAAFSAMPWRFVDYWAMTHDADLDRNHLTKA